MENRTCFVCDREDADIWLPRVDLAFCSDEHAQIFLREWAEQSDPLRVKEAMESSD